MEGALPGVFKFDVFPSSVLIFQSLFTYVGHFGNMRYQSVLDYYQDAYERAIKFQKRNISQRILEMVAEYGGRFLRQEGAGWIQVNESVARDKVAHAFRTRRVASGGVAPVVTPVPSSNDDTLISTGALSSGTKRNKSAMMDSTALPTYDEDYTALDIDPANTVSSDEFFLSEDEHAQPDKRLCV